MKTYEELLDEYEFRTQYPGAGKRHMLVWYTRNEGNHVVITRERTSLLPIMTGVDHRCGPCVELREYWEIELVSPPRKLAEAWRRSMLESDIRIARDIISSRIQSLIRDKGMASMPPNVSVCERFEPSDPDDDIEEDDPGHWECKNCHMGFVIAIDPLELYQLVRKHEVSLQDPFITKKPRKGLPRPGHRVCDAHPPDPNRRDYDPSSELFMLGGNFGHHRPGSLIKKIIRGPEWDIWRAVQAFDSLDPVETHLLERETATFFFHGTKQELPAEIDSYLRMRDAELEMKRAKNKAIERKRRTELNRLESVFLDNVLSRRWE